MSSPLDHPSEIKDEADELWGASRNIRGYLAPLNAHEKKVLAEVESIGFALGDLALEGEEKLVEERQMDWNGYHTILKQMVYDHSEPSGNLLVNLRDAMTRLRLAAEQAEVNSDE